MTACLKFNVMNEEQGRIVKVFSGLATLRSLMIILEKKAAEVRNALKNLGHVWYCSNPRRKSGVSFDKDAIMIAPCKAYMIYTGSRRILCQREILCSTQIPERKRKYIFGSL